MKTDKLSLVFVMYYFLYSKVQKKTKGFILGLNGVGVYGDQVLLQVMVEYWMGIGVLSCLGKVWRGVKGDVTNWRIYINEKIFLYPL